ncbi:MAG TPA: ABC transporter ATP-binding protein [Acidimicrobiia bacterium]|nr:ABC transporter ATP-binding protein [Acidimicrobiia bacterium]
MTGGASVELIGVEKRFRDTVAVGGVSLHIAAGEFFSLLGPSGCGKTTTLRMIAGFEQPTAGTIRIGEQDMHDVPVNRRPTNMVFQNYALFPHLTVFENVAFGLRVQRTSKEEIPTRVEEALAMVQLERMEGRKPGQLSGGQQQRVALARALVDHPAVLLLDEPLGALDLKLRKGMQLELKRLQREVGITFIYVTHDQEEALTMSDRIAVMDRGSVLQVDSPLDLYERPRSRFVADFIGTSNFLQGHITESLPDRLAVSVDGIGTVSAPRGQIPAGHSGPVTLMLRPERLTLGGDDVNKCDAVLEDTVFVGNDTLFLLRLSSGDPITVRHQNQAPLVSLTGVSVGDRVSISWPMESSVLLA